MFSFVLKRFLAIFCSFGTLIAFDLSIVVVQAQETSTTEFNLSFPNQKNNNTNNNASIDSTTSPVRSLVSQAADQTLPETKTAKIISILSLNARLTQDGQDIPSGLIWRVYSPLMGQNNKLPLIANSQGGSTNFNLEPGNYIIHVSYGLAVDMRNITIENGVNMSQTFVLDAGGVLLNAKIPEGKINEKQVSFNIYSDDSENDETALIIANVKAGALLRIKAGTYHVVSNYGSANATVRTDIQVNAGKVSEVTLQHHAAQITLKLVRQKGGEALADTSWSITNGSGDIVRETVGAYASLILAEGDYVAIAKNKEQIFQKEFIVTSGHDEQVEVITDSQNNSPVDSSLD